jgi:RsmE family RNA methyltransferase
MNLLLFAPDDRLGPGRIAVDGRRHRHLAEVLKARPGTKLRVGEIGGKVGTGTVVAIADDRAELAVTLDRDPPAPLPVTLVLALPRPKAVRRILQTVAAMGVKKLFLVAAAKVEKSYWQSPFLAPDAQIGRAHV